MPHATAQALPEGFTKFRTQGDYDMPMGVVFSTGGQRQFVWDKGGKVWVSNWNGSQYIRQTTPVLDISDEVGNWRDFGLLSLCLDPQFVQNGHIYLFYVVDRHHLLNAGTAAYNPAANEYFKASISRVTRYQVSWTNGVLLANLGSRKVLLGETKTTGVPLTHESHAGGTLLFGRDGSLLLSTGDNASYVSIDKGSASETYVQQALADGILRTNENVGAFRSQMLDSHCGKVLRMNPNTGEGLPSNPFYNAANPRSAQSRVWALGFRNPFRMALQPNTGSTNWDEGNPGTLLIGDVGLAVWEDMHLIRQGGENAGWPLFEGLEPHLDYAAVANSVENKDEPNPSNTCNRPFLTFADLLKQPTNPVQTVVNPCSGQPLPGLQRRFIHARPVLDWKHWIDHARTPTFDGSVATATPLSSNATTGAVGNPFQGSTAVGGTYYTGTAFPEAWRNTFFFADYSSNWIRAATLNADGSVARVRELLPNGGGNGIVDVEYNPLDGSLYYVNINSGELVKISFGGNQPPVTTITSTALTGASPLTVNFQGDASSDPNGDPLTYAWDFGDGTSSTVANPTKIFTASGQGQGFTVRLTVSDGRGLTDSRTVQVSVSNPAPTARITGPVNGSQYPLDRESLYPLTANVTDDDLPGVTYAWQVSLRHNQHEHREPVQTDASPTVTISPVGCDGETYYYLIRLTVTDRGGLTASDSVKIYPDCNSPQLAISGLQATTATNAVHLTWTSPAVVFDNVLVVAKAGSGFIDRPSELVYTADANFTGNGAPFYGGKVVYQGVGTNLAVTNLTAGQLYFFRVYTRRGRAWTGGVEVSATPAPPVSTSLTPSADACYRIVARVSGKVLGVEGSSMDNGGSVRQRTNANQPWQQWRLTPTSNGFYRITAQHSGKALDVAGVSTANGALVHQWDYVGGNNQQWALRQDAQGYYQLVARHSGKVLDLKNSSQAEGAEIFQFAANGGQAQQWLIESATCASNPSFSSTACYQITARVSGKVLGVEGGSRNNGGSVRQRTNANQSWQQWRLTPTSNGFYRITAQHSGKALDVAGVSTADNAPLHQWDYVGGNNQQWRITQNADGFYVFTARHSNKAMDVKNSNQNEGGEIMQYTINGGLAQQWNVETVTCVAAGSRQSGDAALGVTTEADASESDFRVYPNPAQDYVVVDLRSATGQPADLTLTDLTGRMYYQRSVDTTAEPRHTISTKALTSGMYVIRVRIAGQGVANRRVVVTR